MAIAPTELTVKEGVTAAGFDAFYRAQWPRVARMASLLVGSVHIGEELAQDSFIVVRERWDEIDHPNAYLHRTLTNRAYRHHRRERLRLLRERAENDVALPSSAAELWDALRALDPAKRTAVVLRFYGDLPLSEIAAAMGRPEGTVASLIHRGLADLRRSLHDA